jgi:hypothetical protein
MKQLRTYLSVIALVTGLQLGYSQTIDLQMTVINASSLSACDGEMDIQCTGCSPFVSYTWADTMGNIIGSGNHVTGICPTQSYCYIVAIQDYNCFNQMFYTLMRTAPLSGPSFQLKTSLKLMDSTGYNYMHVDEVNGGLPFYDWSLYDDYDLSPGPGLGDYRIAADSGLTSVSGVAFDSLYDPFGDLSNNYTFQVYDTTLNFIGYYFSTFYDTVTCSPSYNGLWINAQGYPVSDSVSCDGWAYATGFGGTPPYTYSFSSGAIDSTENSLCPGSYSATITDVNGFQRSATFIVGYPGTYYVTDPGSFTYLDTLYANAEMECGIDYSLPVDTFYVDTAYAVSAWQYVLQWVIVQDTSTFEFTETYWADSTGAYMFGFSIYCNQRSFGSYSFLYGLDLGTAVATGTKPLIKPAGMELYPNPSSGIFSFKKPQDVKKYVVTDQLGRVVQNGGALNRTAFIDLSGCKPGVYFVDITLNNGEILKQKLIKN